DQVNHCQETHEHRADQEVRRWFDRAAPECAGEEREKAATSGDESIGSLGRSCEQRRMFVPIQKPMLVRIECERPECRLSSSIDVALGCDKVDGVFELRPC